MDAEIIGYILVRLTNAEDLHDIIEDSRKDGWETLNDPFMDGGMVCQALVIYAET